MSAVEFRLDGPSPIETFDDSRPFLLDQGGSWEPVAGRYRLTVTPFDQTGRPGQLRTVRFEITGP